MKSGWISDHVIKDIGLRLTLSLPMVYFRCNLCRKCIDATRVCHHACEQEDMLIWTSIFRDSLKTCSPGLWSSSFASAYGWGEGEFRVKVYFCHWLQCSVQFA